MSDDLERYVDLNARLGAIEVLLCEALTWQYFREGMSVEQASTLIEKQAEHLATQAPFQTDDPALSDIATDALREHVRRLSEVVKSHLARLRSSKGGGS